MVAAPTSRVLAVAGVLAAALATCGSAAGATVTHTLKGSINGDANSFVSVKVVVKNGEPKKLQGLKYANLDATCNVDGTTIEPAGELSGNAGKNQNPRIETGNQFNWFSYPSDPPRSVSFFGKLKNGGKKAVGTIQVSSNDTGVCATAEGKVVVKK